MFRVEKNVEVLDIYMETFHFKFPLSFFFYLKNMYLLLEVLKVKLFLRLQES